jgi:hypothetical protein
MFFNKNFFYFFYFFFFIESINCKQFFSDQELKSFLYSLIRIEWPSEEAWKNFIDNEVNEDSLVFNFLNRILYGGDKVRIAQFFSSFFSSCSGINAVNEEDKVKFLIDVMEGLTRGGGELQSGNIAKFVARMQKKYKTEGIQRSDIDAIRSFYERLYALSKEIYSRPYPKNYFFDSKSIIVGGYPQAFDRKNTNLYEFSPFLDEDALLKGLKEEVSKKKKIEFKVSVPDGNKGNYYINIQNNEKLREKFKKIKKIVPDFKIEEPLWQQIDSVDPIAFDVIRQDQFDQCRLADGSMIAIKDLRSKFMFFDFNGDEQVGEGVAKNGIVVLVEDLGSVGNTLKQITEANLIPYSAKIFVLLCDKKNTVQKKLYLDDNGYSTKLNNQGYKVLLIQKYYIEPEKYEQFADMKELLEKEPRALDIHVIDRRNDINEVLKEVEDFVARMISNQSLKDINSGFANDIKKIATDRFLNNIKGLEGTVILNIYEIKKKMQSIYTAIDNATTSKDGDFLSECSLECNKKIVREIMLSPCPRAEKVFVCNAFDAVEKKKFIDSGYLIVDAKPLFKNVAPDLNALMKFFGSFAKSTYALQIGQELITDAEQNNQINVKSYIQKCIDYFKDMNSAEVETFCRQHKFLFVPPCRPEDIAQIYKLQNKKEESDEELLKRRNFLDVDYLTVAHGLSISYDDAKKMVLKTLRMHYDQQGAFKENSNVILYILCNERKEIKDKLESYNPRKEKEMNFILLANSPGTGKAEHEQTNVNFGDCSLQNILNSDSGYTANEFQPLIDAMIRKWVSGVPPRDFFAKKEKNMFLLDGQGGTGKTFCPKLLTKFAYLLMAANHPDGEEYAMDNVFMANSGSLKNAFVASGATKVSNYCAGKRKVCRENKNAWILFVTDEAFSEDPPTNGQTNKKGKREDMETFKKESQTILGREHEDGIQFFTTNDNVDELWDSAFLSRLSRITIQQCTSEGYETHMKNLKIPIGDFSLKEKTFLPLIAPNYRIIGDNFAYFEGLWRVGEEIKTFLNEDAAFSSEQKLFYRDKLTKIQFLCMSKMMSYSEIIKNITDFTELVAKKELIEEDHQDNKRWFEWVPFIGPHLTSGTLRKGIRWLEYQHEKHCDLGSRGDYAKTLITPIIFSLGGYFLTNFIRSKLCVGRDEQAWYNKTMGIASTFGLGVGGGFYVGMKFGEEVCGSVEDRLFNSIAQNSKKKKVDNQNGFSFDIKKAMKEAGLQEKYLFKANIENFIRRDTNKNWKWCSYLIKEKSNLFESFENFTPEHTQYTRFKSIKKFKEGEMKLTPSFDHMFELIEHINKKTNKNNDIDERIIIQNVSNYYKEKLILIQEMNELDRLSLFCELGKALWIFYDLLKSSNGDQLRIKNLKECYNVWSKDPNLANQASSIIDFVSQSCISFEIQPLCEKNEVKINNEKAQYQVKVVINTELMEECDASLDNLFKKLRTINIKPQGAFLEQAEMKQLKNEHDIIIKYKSDAIYKCWRKRIDRLITPINSTIIDILNQRSHTDFDLSLYIDNLFNQIKSGERKVDKAVESDILYLKKLQNIAFLRKNLQQKKEVIKKENEKGYPSALPPALYTLLNRTRSASDTHIGYSHLSEQQNTPSDDDQKNNQQGVSSRSYLEEQAALWNGISY